MFVIEYKTKSNFGHNYTTNFINVSGSKVNCKNSAADYVMSKIQNIEIISVAYVGAL